MVIKGNTVIGAKYGILLQAAGEAITGNRVTGNMLSQVGTGIQLAVYGSAIGDGSADLNKITGNKIINTTTGGIGIRVLAESSYSTLAHADGLVVKGNRIENFTVPLEYSQGMNGSISGVFMPNIIIEP